MFEREKPLCIVMMNRSALIVVIHIPLITPWKCSHPTTCSHCSCPLQNLVLTNAPPKPILQQPTLPHSTPFNSIPPYLTPPCFSSPHLTPPMHHTHLIQILPSHHLCTVMCLLPSFDHTCVCLCLLRFWIWMYHYVILRSQPIALCIFSHATFQKQLLRVRIWNCARAII